MRHLTASLAVFAALTLLAPAGASAQEDTTPPVLLEFSIAPVAFDAGLGDITLNWCATVRDNLSGINRVRVSAIRGSGSQSLVNLGIASASGAPLEATVCGSGAFPQFFPYGVWGLDVEVRDAANNDGNYADPAIGFFPRHDLCAVGTCQIENRPSSELPDSDNDGIPDDADNCPDDPNSDQTDTDLDLIGDVCDPFPFDRDNEQAQCEVDRDQALADLAACEAQRVFVDTDGDGEEDSTDACPGTPLGEAVDGNGCSLLQFCTSIPTPTKPDEQDCKGSDWQNNEPRGNAKDCQVDKQKGLCVPR